MKLYFGVFSLKRKYLYFQTWITLSQKFKAGKDRTILGTKNPQSSSAVKLNSTFFFFFFLAVPMACGSSWARN